MDENSKQAQRKAAMAVLAHSDSADIARSLDAVALPAHENLREATVSRAAVRLSTGEVGFGYTLGRDQRKAQMIALCDALIQSVDHAGPVEAKVLAPLRTQLMAGRNRTAKETAATRVDFYTLVRGEG
jgi:alpha-D-ribose 1-methylphosphonate 5-triphosphate synthase subunit PhnG